MPTGIFHHFEYSAGRMGILVKWLILFGEFVVIEKGLLGSAAPETWRAEIGSPPPNRVNRAVN
jgi:hypothetical protein